MPERLRLTPRDAICEANAKSDEILNKASTCRNVCTGENGSDCVPYRVLQNAMISANGTITTACGMSGSRRRCVRVELPVLETRLWANGDGSLLFAKPADAAREEDGAEMRSASGAARSGGGATASLGA